MTIQFNLSHNAITMELKVAIRTQRKKENKAIRKEDQVPAVIYAKHIDTPFVISFRRQDFVKLYKQTGSSTPITVKGE